MSTESFTKGDAVVYPMHGAGVIEDLEEKNIDGVNCLYYVLRIPIGDLRILVAKENIQNSRIRRVLPVCDIEKILGEVCCSQIDLNKKENWSQRHRDNTEKVKTGCLMDTFSVFYNLYGRENQKGLSSVEKKLMSTAKKIVLSEIMLSYNADKLRAEEILEGHILAKHG